jgi:VWFA-related protein
MATPPPGGQVIAPGRRSTFVLAFTAMLASAASGLQPAPLDAQRFPSAVEVVRLNVLVRGREGPVRGLRASDFDVRDNGVRQQVEHLVYEELPLSVVLALDVSGSVKGEKLDAVKRASLGLLHELRDGDRVALLTFADTLRLSAPLGTNFDLIRQHVVRLEAEGGTSLQDGTFAAMAVGDGVEGRVLAIIFTDGGETASALPEWAVLDAAKRTDTVVYGVRIDEGASALLRRVTSATGGRILDRSSASRLSQSFIAILDEFRSRYVLTYTPAGVAPKGWHRLDVRLKDRPEKVIVREGYVVP